MTLHDTTFGYLNPTAEQKEKMSHLRSAAADYAQELERELPEGPDKTYVLRKLREVAMWANVAVMRLPDGTPREDKPQDISPDHYPPDHPVKGDLGSVPL